MLISLLLMISFNRQLVSIQINLDLLRFEMRDINRNGELLRSILDLKSIEIRILWIRLR